MTISLGIENEVRLGRINKLAKEFKLENRGNANMFLHKWSKC